MFNQEFHVAYAHKSRAGGTQYKGCWSVGQPYFADLMFHRSCVEGLSLAVFQAILTGKQFQNFRSGVMPPFYGQVTNIL